MTTDIITLPTVPPGQPCAECGRPFTNEEWDARHTGLDPLTDIHEACCYQHGPCKQGA